MVDGRTRLATGMRDLEGKLTEARRTFCYCAPRIHQARFAEGHPRSSVAVGERIGIPRQSAKRTRTEFFVTTFEWRQIVSLRPERPTCNARHPTALFGEAVATSEMAARSKCL